MSRRTWIAVAAAVLATLAVIVAVAWYLPSAPEPLTGPALVVQRTLELRRARSTDASAYAEYFLEPAVASELASDGATAKRSPIPAWERPYVSEEASSEADVVVVWRPSKEFGGWPRANVFRLQRVESAWRIADASAVMSGTPLPEPVRP